MQAVSIHGYTIWQLSLQKTEKILNWKELRIKLENKILLILADISAKHSFMSVIIAENQVTNRLLFSFKYFKNSKLWQSKMDMCLYKS